MARSTDAPAPAPADEAAKGWQPPLGDEEFIFKNIASAPSWVDKGWASFDRGPALAVPMGDLYGTGPYHTAMARVGDTVKYTAPKGATPGRFTIIPGEPTGEDATKKPPQQSAASLEDMLKNGMLSPDDLGPDAKAQVASRSPNLQRMIEEGRGAPEPQNIADVVKTS
jgi:hypothetical protein